VERSQLDEVDALDVESGEDVDGYVARVEARKLTFRCEDEIG
jgi:hypothetical protein